MKKLFEILYNMFCNRRSFGDAAEMLRSRVALIAYAASFALVVFSGMADAATVPGAGEFGYDVYDIAVNKIVQGPIGFVAGVMSIAYGGVETVRGNVWIGIPAAIGGAVVLKADSITQTLGAII